ncbi:MAG: CotH kinase family protein [Butyrivibrio sp.]|nr:CotH kinase family protein [Butyrivibrio sp.]MBP3826117.1 CotH kinase family protein [Butyrivibrio sp.]
MSTHRYIDRVCIIITIIAVLVTALFMNGERLGIVADDSMSFSYEDKLFDDSYVHTIDIEISDWDGLIENATSEEYYSANVTIDGDTVKNVGIRAKGNTSLSTVSQLDSDRYSFKIEFDCYQSNNNYYGLDKLCLNNLIQDYTMMKDYLTYKLMNEFGASAPLVSFAFITVNGEDWGLYLAVEAVEESFLQRNYGSNYGELYKPDSMSMGGGRGNGGDFDMREMDFDKMGMKNPFELADSEGSGNPGKSGGTGGGLGSLGGIGEPGGGPGGFGMGSDDSKLIYSDDDTDSYSNIFDSAKTGITKADKKRLIDALKNMNEGLSESDADKIAEAVSIDEVLRYMVVHNFVVNGDSYTGSMIHNFYLYEENGLLSMIPWDYNLAYGTFQAEDADGAVNDPIDTPLSITEGSNDRPMFSWITSCDEYLEMYHKYFQEFLNEFYTSGYITELIDSTHDMIAEYVDRDSRKFCTMEEFETGVETIRTFVQLRCESIQGQLDGTIGSTDSAQEENADSLIDASSINLSDMGSMGGGRDQGGPGKDSHEGGGPGSNRHGGQHSRGDSDGDSKSGNGSDAENFNQAYAVSTTDWIYTGVSALVILTAILFALKYKNRK